MTLKPLRFAAWLCATLSAGTLAVAMATPPVTGPFCTEGCFVYPYLDILPRFPRDYLWMFLAIPQLGSFLLLLAALHAHAKPGDHAWSLSGLAFGTIASGTLMVTYWVQLAVIQPSLLQGETDGIALLTQFNPHGLFIALEEIGYLLIALSLGLMSGTIQGRGRLLAFARWSFRLAPLAAVAATAWAATTFGHAREYRLEVALIAIDMLVLIVGPAFMGLAGSREAAT
jgi:hypothetical protein